MKKTLLATLIGAFLVGCVAPQEEEAFHPTDALLIGGNDNIVAAEGEGADLGLDDEPAGAFHPTDALLIGGNGGFNPSADDGGADLGDYASESAAPATAFHPTDALLIGGNGGFNPTGEGKGADLGGY